MVPKSKHSKNDIFTARRMNGETGIIFKFTQKFQIMARKVYLQGTWLKS